MQQKAKQINAQSGIRVRREGVYVIWPSVKRPGDPLARSKKAFVNWPSSKKAA